MPDALPPIDYQPDASLRAIRRGVRWMVLLTLLNTILLGATVAGPGLSAFVRQQWAEYQAAKAQRIAATQAAAAAALAATKARATREKALAGQAAAMSFRWPVGSLVFAEDFAVNTLPIVGSTSATLPATRNATVRGSPAAAAAVPAVLKSSVERSEAILFAHARRARPGFSERLVIVSVGLDLELDSHGRGLRTRTLVPTDSGDFENPLGTWTHSFDLARTVRPRGAPPEPPALRFFAGQPDPLDDSRWTIRYEFGDGVGTITGRLLSDDRVVLAVDGPLQPIFH